MSAPLAAPADRRMAVLVITLLTINAVIWLAVFLTSGRPERQPVTTASPSPACSVERPAEPQIHRTVAGVSYANPT